MRHWINKMAGKASRAQLKRENGGIACNSEDESNSNIGALRQTEVKMENQLGMITWSESFENKFRREKEGGKRA